MPKRTAYALVWRADIGDYELRAAGAKSGRPLAGDPSWLAGWLADQRSLAFHGRDGHLTLLKEARARGGDYWYAYRSQGGRTTKRYLGRGADLTPARLEEAARALAAPPAPKLAPPSHERPTPPMFLAAKLQPPRLPPALVARPRLLERLDALWHTPTVLVVAPAGFGKSTLVGQWAASRAARGLPPLVGWLALDAGENDPVRFWRYVAAACRAFHPDVGQRALALLDAAGPRPFAPPPIEPALTALLNDLAGLERPALLVLEDYHLITTSQIHASLAFFLAHLPAGAHLLLISREEPPLPLPELRASGRLAELRAAELRFTHDELRAFVAQALPVALSDEAIRRVEERTEGWAAGLRLAALAAQGQAAPERAAQAIEAFSGDQRPVADYLAAAVLAALPPTIQLFLLQTSALPRLSAPLCNAVTGRDDSAETLAWLERSNLFLTPLGGSDGWYRYHGLFAEAMQQVARQRLPESELRACHERASAWHAQHGMLDEAIEASLAAGLPERAADLLEQLVATRPLAEPPEPARLRRWLEQLPESLLHQRPTLCFSYGMALLRTSGGPPSALADRLMVLAEHAEAGWRRAGELGRVGELYAARALFSLWQGRIDLAVDWSRRALELLPASAISWRGICLGFVGKAQVDQGQLDAAASTLAEAHALTTATWTRPGTRAHAILLADVYAGQSDPHRAAALYAQALADAEDAGDLVDIGLAQLGLARLAYERNDLAAAIAGARRAYTIGEAGGNAQLQVRGALLLARALRARGEAQAAHEQLAAALALARPAHPEFYREALTARARLQLEEGALPEAQRQAAELDTLGPPLSQLQQEQEALLKARLLIAQGDPAAALEQLGRLLTAAQAAGRHRSACEIQLLIALALAANDEPTAAAEALRPILAPARSAGYRRLLLDEGNALAAPLRAIGPQLRDPRLQGYLRTLLRAFAQEQIGDAGAPPLSRQERRVLGLLAESRSNDEIAQALVVSPNTVKTQLRQIYRKLGATSRAEAVRIARELGIL